MRRTLALVGLLLSGCSARPSTEEAARLADARVDRFEELERWALRSVAVETVPATVEAFEARIFAPMDGDSSVVDAWIARTGTAPFAASAHGLHAPFDADAMTTVRPRDHQEVRVGVLELDDPRTREADTLRVVVIERTSRPSATESISFAVAFEHP